MSTSNLSFSSSCSSEDFWLQLHQKSAEPKPTFLSTLRLRIKKICGKSDKSSRVGEQTPKPDSRDKFDDVLKEFEIKLNTNQRFMNDNDYIKEFSHHINTWRKNEAFKKMFDSEDDIAVYDDVFSEYSDVQEDYSTHYSDLQEEYTGNYSDVNCLEDYSDVYSENSVSSEPAEICETGYYYNCSSTYSELLPPPLPRRLSDSRPPARPPVPSYTTRRTHPSSSSYSSSSSSLSASRLC